MPMPSILRSEGTAPPPDITSVVNQSTECTSSLLTLPAGTLPGQRMMHGARFDPSSEVKYPPRHGPEDPSHWPPAGSGSMAGNRKLGSPPLSEAHTTIVSPARPR